MLVSNRKDVPTKLFQAIDFLNVHYSQDNELLESHKQKKKLELPTRFRDKTCGKQPWKLAYVIQHVLQGFTVKNNEGESMEANDLSHIL